MHHFHICTLVVQQFLSVLSYNRVVWPGGYTCSVCWTLSWPPHWRATLQEPIVSVHTCLSCVLSLSVHSGEQRCNNPFSPQSSLGSLLTLGKTALSPFLFLASGFSRPSSLGFSGEQRCNSVDSHLSCRSAVICFLIWASVWQSRMCHLN